MDEQEKWLREVESKAIMEKYGIAGYSSPEDQDDNNDKPNKKEE